MTIAIALGAGLCGLTVGGSFGVFVGAILGARRHSELEQTLARYERRIEESAELHNSPMVTSGHSSVQTPHH